MRFLVTGVVLVCLAVAVLATDRPAPQPPAPATELSPQVLTPGKYTIIGWNDLGMHCISPRFKEMAILPPANTLRAIVIERSHEPRLVTSGVSVTYSMPDNQKFSGKTDFWTYAPKLFGKTLKMGYGLTGNTTSGTMKATRDFFEATAIPALPVNDDGKHNSYQKAYLKLNGKSNNLIVVVPVSEEMNCNKCHASGGIAARNLKGPTLESNILTLHDQKEKTTLMANRPVLCASCHQDNALGAAGKRGVPNLSLAMHGKHAGLPADQRPNCYDCHPGVRTQCTRSAIAGMGPVKDNPRCEQCHGSLQKVAQSIQQGRQPWLQEPTCAQCHGSKYSTGTTLYRNAKGHGGVYCVACHNSPHAWWPSMRAADNSQPMGYQGNAKPLGYKNCVLCHTDKRSGTVPPHDEDD